MSTSRKKTGLSKPKTKVILRTDTEINDIPDSVLEELLSVIPNGKKADIDYDFRSIAMEQKHIIHYQRRMEAVGHGTERLLNSIDFKGPGRANIDAKLKALQENKREALARIEKDHEQRKLGNKEIKDRLNSDLIDEQMKDKSKEEGFTEKDDKSDHKKIAAIKAQIGAIDHDVGSIAPYQNILEDYVKQVNKILHEEAYIPKKKIKKALGRAEQYAELSEGRPPLCTVTRLDADKEKYPDGTWLVQVEVPQDPLSNAKKEELLQTIQLIRGKELDDPDLPQWYKEMPELEKELFFETFKGVKSIDDITKLVPAISSKLRSIPGVANFSRHTTILMDDKGKVISRNELSRSSHVASRDMKDAAQCANIAEDNINHIIDNMLAEQANKLAQLSVDRKLDASPIVLPVLMQTLITPANIMGPDGALLKDRDEAIKRILRNPVRTVNVYVMIDGKPQMKTIDVKLEIFATNHPLNYFRYLGAGTGRINPVKSNTLDSALSTDPNLRDMQRLTRFAAQYMKKYKPIDYLAEGRDVHLMSSLPKNLSKYKDSYIVVDQKQAYYVNHDGTYRDAKIKNFDDLNAAIKNLNPNNDTKIHLTQHQVKSVITSNGGHTADDASYDFPLLYALVRQFNYVAPKMATEIQDKELYLSSIQQLMAREMGIAYGSCVSGKDRKGISIIYTDAMAMYFKMYGHIPPPAATGTDENVKRRENFVKLFALTYVTLHQHANAGQNSKGADGLKTPLQYLPRDMIIAVIKLTFNKWIHKQCDRLASNNEIKHIVFGKIKKLKIGASNLKDSTALFFHLSGNRKETKALLDEKKRLRLVESLESEMPILDKIAQALPEKSFKNPTGINQLIKCNNEGGSLHELATICKKRIEASDKDRPSLKLYEAIVDLARNPKSESGSKALSEFANTSTNSHVLKA